MGEVQACDVGVCAVKSGEGSHVGEGKRRMLGWSYEAE